MRFSVFSSAIALTCLWLAACSSSSPSGSGLVTVPNTVGSSSGSEAASGSEAGSDNGGSSAGESSGGYVASSGGASASGSASGGSVSASGTTAGGSGVGVSEPEPTDAAEGSDAAVVVAPTYLGSPLCNASAARGCYPDNLPAYPVSARSCRTAPDGGTYDPDAGYADAALACHVSRDDAGAPLPECTPSGPNQDGASCHMSTDCAAGSECVGNPGICRHYCCSGVGPCSSSEFCDIRPKAQEPSTEVPVCVPIRSCGLIDQWSDAGACPAQETCAVARYDTGATSCVPIGTAGDGESCATDHCASGLICLGSTCFKLCHTAAPSECSKKQVCKAALPLFPNPSVGVCEASSDAGP